jgi:hypothetical protein
VSTVFISYSHDSDEHKQRVQALAERLRGALSASGVRIVIDRDRLPGGPDEGWLDWSECQVRDADQVLMVCSERYRDSYEGRTPPGTGLGVGWEAGLIKQTLYDARGVNPRFRVVLFTGEDAGYVPLGLERYHAFRLWQGDADLIAWLRQAGPPAAAEELIPIRWPDAPATVSGALADRSEEFACFERMLRGQWDERILLLHGPSGRGKTVLLKHFSDLVEQSNVAYAKVDLKGCPTLDDVLQAVALDLPDRLVPSSRRAAATARGNALLQDLELAREPVVLAFDTYEQRHRRCAALDRRRSTNGNTKAGHLVGESCYTTARSSGYRCCAR